MEVSMKRRLAVLLAITLAVSPLWTVPARAAETAETGVTFDAEGAADTEPESEPETKHISFGYPLAGVLSPVIGRISARKVML
jgi:hypothetical protein